MDINTFNLSPVKRSCCLRNCLCFICKQPNCSMRNHPCKETPAHPAYNPERTRAAMTTPAPTPIKSDLGKYIKELEGKGRKPAELLCLLQLAIEANKKDECVFLDKEVIAISSSLIIASVLVANKSERAIHFPIHLQYGARTVVTTAPIDCGVTRNFIDPSLIH